MLLLLSLPLMLSGNPKRHDLALAVLLVVSAVSAVSVSVDVNSIDFVVDVVAVNAVVDCGCCCCCCCCVFCSSSLVFACLFVVT